MVHVPESPGITEAFLLFAIDEAWDERRERPVGGLAYPIIGAQLLELALTGALRLDRGRFTVQGETGDAELDAFGRQLAKLSDQSAIEAIRRLAAQKKPQPWAPWKARLEARGIIQENTRRHLGLFRRSNIVLVREDAQQELTGEVARAAAGNGIPTAEMSLLLGLIEAAGMLETVVPPNAAAFSRKRIRQLVLGRDPLGYSIDPAFRKAHDVALQEIYKSIRLLTGQAA